MKRHLFRMAVSTLLTFTAFMLPSCDIKDDELWERVDELFGRVEKLENACEQMNTDIHSIQSVLSAIQNNYSITSVKPLENEEGYQISFSNGSEITIHHGKDGENGSDGKDGDTPTISIKDMGNGRYAWLVNGEILCDAQGSPIPVNGQDGKDGEDGEDGKDGYNGSSAPTPMVKTGSELISSGFDGSWDREAVYISVNRGISWTKISAGNGSSIFSSVDTSKAGVITFTLNNGIKFTVPRTDDLASLILGEWYYYRGFHDATYIFNENGTYSMLYLNGQEKGSGKYEILDNRNCIILHRENESERLINIITVDEKFIRVTDLEYGSNDEVDYFYRPNAFVFDKTEINAPQEGGIFIIQVDTKFPFMTSENNYSMNSNGTFNIYSSVNSFISYTTKATDNSIEIEIEPNMSNLKLTTEFDVEDTYGNRIATITINQEKNSEIQESVSLSEQGKACMIDLYYQFRSAYSGLYNIDRDYTTGRNENLKPETLTASNQLLEVTWVETYSVINQLNKILNQAEKELYNGPLKAPLETLRAILYYNLAIFWGNVSYVTEDNVGDIVNIGQCLSTNKLFEKLIPQLKNAIDVLEERAAPTLSEYNFENIDDAIYLSKDVARMTLAQIYIYQGEYKEAEALLQKISDNNFYDYNNDESIFYHGHTIYQYTELLLGLAECKLYSDIPNDADIFINKILDNYSWIEIESTDKKTIMKEIFINRDIHSYFAFLKRNGLAKETIGITSDYKLLFPIPQSELNLNPNMVQNPGY